MTFVALNNNTNKDLDTQLSFLIKREMYVTYFNVRKYPYFLVGFTAILMLSLYLINSKDYFSFKSFFIVLVALGWLFFIVLFLSFLIKYLKRLLWKKKTLKYKLASNQVINFYFDESKIIFEEESYKTELDWNYYTYWIENKNSIFLFTESSIFESICFSKLELGEKNYLKFKSIALERLELLI